MNTGMLISEVLQPAVVRITLNRPEKRNALSMGLMEALCGELDRLAPEETVSVVVLQGSGPVFCAGLDLEEGLRPELSDSSGVMVARTLRALRDCPQVVIASAHGAAVAGGAGLLLACDLVVAEESLRIGFPEARRGLVPGLVMTYLQRRVREVDANELLLTGTLIGARRAREMGLVNWVVPAEELVEETGRRVAEVLKCGPRALVETKRFSRSLSSSDLKKDLRRALEIHQRVRQGQEAHEGITAFLEKRPPAWQR